MSAGRRRRAGLALAAPAALLAAGCGASSPDLFIVTRSGSAGTSTVLVTEEGVVRCNGGPVHRLGDQGIIEARTITEDLHGPVSHHLSLPAQRGSVFRYQVRDAEGSASFADNSPGQPKVLEQLQLVVERVVAESCHGPSR